MIEGIFLLLGSNLGDKQVVLSQACELIEQRVGKIMRRSKIYETAAWGKTDQPSFLNQVVEITSTLSPFEILEHINQIEELLGRVREEKWGARIIDIDILYYSDHIESSEALSIPHPGIPDRRFTLIPLTELAPDMLHPVIQKTNSELLNTCQDQLEVIAIN